MAKKDANQNAKYIADIATGEIQKPDINNGKNPAAVLLGRLGGLKGGRARAESMTPEKRKQLAQEAANSRWNKSKK